MYKIISPETVYIAEGVVVEDGAVIYPNNTVSGRTVLRKGAVLYPNNIVEDADIEAVFNHPREEYTKKLIAAIPKCEKKKTAGT